MSGSMKRILLVDDEPDLSKMIMGRLKMWGYDVTSAPDGQQGLELARSMEPDLLLLDLMLPKLNGYEVCTLLKQDARFQRIPIIMLTARAQQSDRRQALECGADAYLPKPYQAEELRRTIEGLLAKGERPAAGSATND